jgi:anti-sigma factor RsiW
VSRAITCREFVEFLDDYVAGSLSEDRRAELDGHLAECPPCVAYLKTYRATIQMGRDVLRRTDDPVPEEVPDALVQAILSARKKT